MAEFVQTSIEEMLAELEQMQRVGLFTKSEIRQILQKRKGFEYKLRRRTKVKDDYLKYAQFEINLLSLVKKRRKRTGYTHKKLEIDLAIVHRIHRLFRSAIMRFHDDVTLWLTHIEFCKKRREKITASKQYTRMLQVHGKKADLWVQAAKWEFEENNNPENARSLLQRALRFNPTSKHLWREYYRLELLFAEKMIRRKQVMGVVDEDMQDVVLEGGVAKVVYEQALQAIPGDIEFLLSFLPICQLFKFSKDQEEKIFTDLQELHPNKALTWDALAKRCLKTGKKKSKGSIETLDGDFHAKYREAIQTLQTEEIWSLYLKACLEIVEHSPKRQSLLKARVRKTLAVFAEAIDNVSLSPQLWEQWLDLLTSVGLVEKAVQVGELATERCPASASLWKRQMEITIATGTAAEKLHQLLNQAKKKVPQKETWPLIQLVLQYDIQNAERDRTVALLEEAMYQCKEVSMPAKDFYLQWEYMDQGISQARQVYKTLAKASPKSLEFYLKYINMESAQDNGKIVRMRKAFEDAVRDFGSKEPDLWLEFIKLETGHPSGQPEKAAEIYHRAVKTLTGQCNQEFINKYTLTHTSRDG